MKLKSKLQICCLWILAIGCTASASAQQVILSYDSTNPNGANGAPSPDLPAAEVADGISALNLARGPGLTPNEGITINSSGWTTSSTLDLNSDDYLSWGWEAAGQSFDLSSLRLQYDRSPNGAERITIAISVDGASFQSIFTDNFVDPSDDEATIDLSVFTNVSAAEFRLFGYDAVTGTGAFDLEEFQTDPSRSVEIRGFAVAVPEPASGTVVLLVGVSTRIIHDAWASTWRKLVSLGFCSRFVVLAGHQRREIDEFAKLASASGESLQRADLTPVVVNNSGSTWLRRRRSTC